MTTVDHIVRSIMVAERRLDRADYIDSQQRREREIDEASAQLRAARKLTIPHRPCDPCPVLPGTTCHVRYMGAMTVTTTPETNDWNLITEWKPDV